jgi:NADH-quinone oxidoreductase subunit L
MLIGTLSLIGFGIPHVAGFAGFHSKDAIIEAAYAAHTPNNYVFWVLTFAALLTSFYSWRLVFMTFYGKTRADHHTYDHAHESPPVMLVPLLVLAVGAVFAGIAFQGVFIGEGQGAFWAKALSAGPENHVLHAMHELPHWVGWMPFIAMALGFVIAYVYYVSAPWLPEATARNFQPLYQFLLHKWYFDELYDFVFVRGAKALGRFLWKRGDGTVIDGTIDGTASGVLWTTMRAVRLQTGYVYHYAFAMLIGLAILATYAMYAGGAFQ